MNIHPVYGIKVLFWMLEDIARPHLLPHGQIGGEDEIGGRRERGARASLPPGSKRSYKSRTISLVVSRGEGTIGFNDSAHHYTSLRIHVLVFSKLQNKRVISSGKLV